MKNTFFVTSTITTYTYKLTVFDREKGETVTVDYTCKTKASPVDIIRSYNKAHKELDKIAVDCSDNPIFSEKNYRLELSKFVAISQPVEKRLNGDYICRNLSSYTYKLTVFDREKGETVTVDYTCKTKASPVDIIRGYNKAHKELDKIAVDCSEDIVEINQMYCCLISDFVAAATECKTESLEQRNREIENSAKNEK